MKMLFLMLLLLILTWNCSENSSRKCAEIEITEEEIEGVKITVTECVKWADEVTKTK
jgi:hypothetical protein